MNAFLSVLSKFNILCLLGIFFKSCLTIAGKLKWINLLLSICFCSPDWFFNDYMGSSSELICVI